MKKTAILIMILMMASVFPGSLSAQETEVEFQKRNIVAGEEVVWEGEVHIKDVIRLNEGGKIIIKAGTRVFFHNIGGITINGGVIQARGEMGKEIIFENTKEAREKGFTFGGIKLIKVNPNQSYITGCVFKNATNGITCVFTSLKISNNIFDNCMTAIELYQESHATIENNLIKGGDIGIKSMTKSSPKITNNLIKNIKTYGIQLLQSSKPTVTKNTFKYIGRSAVYTTQGVVANITNNLIEGCENGVHSYQVGSNQRIMLNHISNCRIAIYNDGFSKPLVKNNYVVGNIVGIANIQFSSPQITNNDIIGNAQGILCIRKSTPNINNNNIIDNDEGLFLNYSSYPELTNNNMVDNIYSVKLGKFQSSDWEKKSMGSSEAMKREAARKQSKVDFNKMPKQEFPDYFDASKNYWGQDGIDELKEKKGNAEANISFLYDYYDKNTVVYEGWGDSEYKLDKIKYNDWLTELVDIGGVKEKVEGGIVGNPKDISVY